jgi:hypothetical protein
MLESGFRRTGLGPFKISLETSIELREHDSIEGQQRGAGESALDAGEQDAIGVRREDVLIERRGVASDHLTLQELVG